MKHSKRNHILNPRNSFRNARILALYAVAVFSTTPAGALEIFTPPGDNIALRKPYTIDPEPNYDLCTDPGDAEQLTDGKAVTGGESFWTGTGCVGWLRAGVVTVTIDLGEEMPIGGVSFRTAAGGSGVAWPAAVLVLVSEDGKTFRYAGELRTMSAKFGTPDFEGVQVHEFRTNALKTRGRFLRLGIVATGAYVFSDEVEVYRGSDDLPESAVVGPVVDDLKEFVSGRRTALALGSWISSDIDHVRSIVAAANIDEDKRRELIAATASVEKANATVQDEPAADYRGVYPLSGNHGRLGEILARLRRAEGYPPLFSWHNDRWETTRPWDVPPAAPQESPGLKVRMVANERRAETLNIANFTDSAITATVSFSGLPGGRMPDYIDLRSVEHVAMQSGGWAPDALPAAPRSDTGWEITLHPGVSRQLWLSFFPRENPEPGRYEGEVIIETGQSAQKLSGRLELIVEPFRLPDEPAMALTMWDYTAGGGRYDLNKGNVQAAVTHMQSYNYNAPWAANEGFPNPREDHFDADDNLVKPLDFTIFDDWVAMWPDARYYLIYIEVKVGRHESLPFAGAEVGTDAFNRRVGATMRAWADHAREIGVDPGKIALLLIDEPGGTDQALRVTAWARAIKAAAPEIQIYEDPHIAPEESEALEMLELCNIICPPVGRYREGGEAMVAALEKLRADGRELWLYSSPTRHAGVYYRDHLWECWKAKATGIGFWSYGDAGAIVNSWNQLGSTTAIFSPIYIDSNSVTDSKGWLAIIEGIQDYEYLRLLRNRVDELEAAGIKSPSIDEASSLLGSLPDSVLSGNTPFDEARLNILDTLLLLQ